MRVESEWHLGTIIVDKQSNEIVEVVWGLREHAQPKAKKMIEDGGGLLVEFNPVEHMTKGLPTVDPEVIHASRRRDI